MPPAINPLKPVTNVQLLDAIRADASSDYQRRIPAATQAGVQATVKALTAFRPSYNEFLDALVNRIGTVIARNISWDNPLAKFKRGMLSYGDTIEEIQVGLLKAHVYDPDREALERDIFGTERPDVQSNFHRVNRQNMYKVTINEPLLQRAFLEPDGLSSFVSQLMTAPSTSDQWDEFLLTVQLFKEYEANGGFYHVHVPDVQVITSSADDAKYALRKMRAMADTLKFVSTKYNAAHMPSFAQPDELELFVTPEFNAALDVEALAAAFHIERAEMYGRINPIPRDKFDMEGCQAILTVRDFFVIADQRLENTSQYNPVTLHNNYFLHHWEVVSASRFVPAVMFTTGADDEVISILPDVASVSAITLTDITDAVVTDTTRGQTYSASASAVTSPTGGDNSTVRWSVANQTSPKTFITSSGVLHVAGDEGASTLTLTATSTYLNPSNIREDGKTATATVTVSGPAIPAWPAAGLLALAVIKGVAIPIVSGTTAYVFEYAGTFTKDDVHLTSDGPISATVTVAGGKVATVTVDPGVGAPTVFTFTAEALATGATAGTPGSFTPAGSIAPANLAELTAGPVTANPTTAWTTGQRVVLLDTTTAHWSGTAWVAGNA